MHQNRSRLLKLTSVALLLVPYFWYVGFVIRAGRGPVDYETFMDIGRRLLEGGEVYGPNSYYPLPFVMVFAFLSWLPRPISIALWLLAPVVCALFMTHNDPLALLYAPLFGHFAGGQASIFGMLGLWGYRKSIGTCSWGGGVFLALTILKPQLGIIPLAFALTQWAKAFWIQKRLPGQVWAFVSAIGLMYLPGFLVDPDWLVQWLSHPRPLFERAMSGLVPRTLLYILSPQTAGYWVVLIVVSFLLLLGIWFLNHRVMTLDLAVLWGFVVSPLVHDYDLIQLIPLLTRPGLAVTAVLLSIPGWLVILFAYGSDSAWYAFTILAPGLLGVLLYQACTRKMRVPSPT